MTKLKIVGTCNKDEIDGFLKRMQQLYNMLCLGEAKGKKGIASYEEKNDEIYQKEYGQILCILPTDRFNFSQGETYELIFPKMSKGIEKMLWDLFTMTPPNPRSGRKVPYIIERS